MALERAGPGAYVLASASKYTFVFSSSLAFGKRVGVKAVFAVAVRAEQAVVSVTGQGLEDEWVLQSLLAFI